MPDSPDRLPMAVMLRLDGPYADGQQRLMETVLLPAIRAAGCTVVPQQDLGLVITMPADWEPPADMPAPVVTSELAEILAPIVLAGGDTPSETPNSEISPDLAERLAPVVAPGGEVFGEALAPDVVSDLTERLAAVVAPGMMVP